MKEARLNRKHLQHLLDPTCLTERAKVGDEEGNIPLQGDFGEIIFDPVRQFSPLPPCAQCAGIRRVPDQTRAMAEGIV